MATYKIASGSAHGLRDTEDFITSLDQSIASLPAGWRDLFDSRHELVVTRAPGRLDLMGGIADYSGSLVLQMPIRSAVHIALQRNEGDRLRIASLPHAEVRTARLFEMELGGLVKSGSLIDYCAARRRFAGEFDDYWAAYVAGAFLVLMREKDLRLNHGARILIESDVPEGKGLGSSAALEVAAMQALAGAYKIDIPAPELALFCQQVENLIVGAPCGLMDQLTAACGETNRLLELLCQPAVLKGTLALPEELEVFGIDSGIRHSVGGSDYRTVRTAAFMGYRVIADINGFPTSQRADGCVHIDDSRWNGYLANIGPDDFERDYAAHIPERMSGKVFLDRYLGITDRIAPVEPAVDYPVRHATRHPIYEHARVNSFAAILKDWQGLDQTARLGELMLESHESYSKCGLGSEGTDELVALVYKSSGGYLYGAKITGGGSGGTVAILARRGAHDAVHEIAERYRRKTGFQPTVVSGSSPGAAAFGHVTLMPG
jgi:galactokinase